MYSLTRSDVNGGSAVTLGAHGPERLSKDSNLFIMPMPLSDASATFVFDFEGATEDITLNGFYQADTLGNLQTFVNNLRSFINGAQTVTSYVSDLFGTINVWVKNIDVTYSSGTPLEVGYVISLMRGTA